MAGVSRDAPSGGRTAGYHRFQVIAAYTNGISLFAIVVWIVAEAIGRLFAPVTVMPTGMLVIAILGLLVNVVAFWILHHGGAGNLNVRGAAVHVMGDMLGSVGAIAAALVIMWTGWMPIDPILSVLVALLILRSAWSVVRESSHVLLEGTPDGIDAARVGAALGTVPGVIDVHHVHAWSLTPERPLLTLHAVVDDAADPRRILAKVNRVLKERFGVEHATVQLEQSNCINPENARHH